MKCRVLHVHLKRRQLTLTAKKSLVQSDFQLTKTADAKVNMLLTGYISKMIDAGAIVQFYGGARGWRRGRRGRGMGMTGMVRGTFFWGVTVTCLVLSSTRMEISSPAVVVRHSCFIVLASNHNFSFRFSP